MLHCESFRISRMSQYLQWYAIVHRQFLKDQMQTNCVIRVLQDPPVPRRPLRLHNVKMTVHYQIGDYVQRVCSCESTWMIVPSIPWFKKGIQRPGPWAATTKTGRVWYGTKAIGFTGGILGASRGSYLPERTTWTTIPSYQGDNTGGSGLSYTL